LPYIKLLALIFLISLHVLILDNTSRIDVTHFHHIPINGDKCVSRFAFIVLMPSHPCHDSHFGFFSGIETRAFQANQLMMNKGRKVLSTESWSEQRAVTMETKIAWAGFEEQSEQMGRPTAPWCFAIEEHPGMFRQTSHKPPILNRSRKCTIPIVDASVIRPGKEANDEIKRKEVDAVASNSLGTKCPARKSPDRVKLARRQGPKSRKLKPEQGKHGGNKIGKTHRIVREVLIIS
jgi:hypothetical protein